MLKRTIASLVAALLPAGVALAQTADLPQRTDDNLIVATYNIKFLGQQAHDVDRLAEVIQHFDVCGIQEVKVEKAVRELAEALEALTGHDWGYVYGVRTHRPLGTYHEAYAAVWRRDRAQLGDGLVSNVWDLEEAYRNDPFMVSFVSANGNFDFTMLLVHTRWSNDNEGTRANEVAMLVEQVSWMREFVNERDWILAGDFNYSGTSSHMQNMAEALELEQVDLNEKTTFNGDASGYKSAYDHIYLSASETSEFVGPCRAMDVTTVVYGSHTQANGKRARSELSDHLPVWAVFSTAGPDDD